MLHCAALVGMIYASLVHTDEHRHVHNVSDFPQAKLHSEMNGHFLFNEHGDQYSLLHNNSVHVILLNFKENVHKTVTLGCKL